MTNGKFKLERVKGIPVSDEELISDLLDVAKRLNVETVPQLTYRENGRYADTTLSKRFGSWNEALKKAGLEITHENRVSDESLFENLLNLWQHLGRQPRRSDLTNKLSQFSQSPYNRRFESWTKALESFVNYANSEEIDAPISDSQSSSTGVKKTGRDPSLRLRYKVLVRDNFSCKQCGASPAKDPSVELHIDHIAPWSKGGETVFENLQTLCLKCNLGKSSLE
jgi:hypothetical protein